LTKPSPPPPVSLEPHRQALYDKLASKELILAQIYAGAIIVLNQENNPDRLALAAHNIRELIEKIPLYADIVPQEISGLQDQVDSIQNFWDKNINKLFQNSTFSEGKEITKNLDKFLKKLSDFFSWREKNRITKREEFSKTMQTIDPLGKLLPKALETCHAQEWTIHKKYFQTICHHKDNTNINEFDSRLRLLERFIIERLIPRTHSDIVELDKLIAICEGESYDHK